MGVSIWNSTQQVQCVVPWVRPGSRVCSLLSSPDHELASSPTLDHTCVFTEHPITNALWPFSPSQ